MDPSPSLEEEQGGGSPAPRVFLATRVLTAQATRSLTIAVSATLVGPLAGHGPLPLTIAAALSSTAVIAAWLVYARRSPLDGLLARADHGRGSAPGRISSTAATFGRALFLAPASVAVLLGAAALAQPVASDTAIPLGAACGLVAGLGVGRLRTHSALARWQREHDGVLVVSELTTRRPQRAWIVPSRELT
jgi:hypothetical protein